jgi:putative SOS response-associated peptidase YedK
VPFWGKDAVNADSATMDEKRAFRRIYTKNRCVIPCDGFYAWKPGEDGKPRQPMRIVPTNRRVLGMAGIYEVWLSPGSRDELRTCTVLTTGANRLIAPMSERMPVLLDEDGIDQWLDMKLTDKNRLRHLLRPAPADMLRAYPVSPRVNNTTHEEPDCIEELDLRLPLAKA